MTKNSVALDISGTIYHMIVICGTQVSKMAQNDKKLSLSHSISQEAYIIWLWFLLHNDISWCFFHFFKILTFCVVWWAKRQKMAQNDKIFCPSQSVSQEPNLIWLWFLVHKCKIMISLAFFFFSFFQILIFGGFGG